jgi:hypothetical protein
VHTRQKARAEKLICQYPYQGNVVIPIAPKAGVDESNVSSSADVGGTDKADESEDVYAKLEKLSDLKDRGIITEEEFETEKKQLLGEN